MEHEHLYIATQVALAIGSFLVVVAAVYGDKIRDYLFGPKLQLQLVSERGELTTRAGYKTLYWTIRVENKRNASLARRVRVLCKKIEKKQEGGSFVVVPPVIPLQLKWSLREYPDFFSNITDEDYCDLGSLGATTGFVLGLIQFTNNFGGRLLKNETLRVHFVVSAENYTSRAPYILEIFWDGTWIANADDMMHHLVIKECSEATSGAFFRQ
jgi:hypothetical protein